MTSWTAYFTETITWASDEIEAETSEEAREIAQAQWLENNSDGFNCIDVDGEWTEARTGE